MANLHRQRFDKILVEMIREGKQNKRLGGIVACRTADTCIIYKTICAKQCFIKNWMGRKSNVFSARGNVSSLKGKGDFAETEKTGKEHYILWFMAILLLSISVRLKRRPSTILFQAIFDYASPVRVATSDVNIVKTGISPKRALRN